MLAHAKPVSTMQGCSKWFVAVILRTEMQKIPPPRYFVVSQFKSLRYFVTLHSLAGENLKSDNLKK